MKLKTKSGGFKQPLTNALWFATKVALPNSLRELHKTRTLYANFWRENNLTRLSASEEKMKQIAKFKAIDGREFNSEIDCLKHEAREKDIKAIMETIEPLPVEEGCGFANGDGYIQQDISKVEIAMVAIYKMAAITYKFENVFYSSPFECRNGIIGRILNDSDCGSCYNAWYRFMCMDEKGREWGQPYYASHP